MSVAARSTLREDVAKVSGLPNAEKRKWELYLKGTTPHLAITFDSEYASKQRNVTFITPVHPLVRQAAAFFAVNAPTYINIHYDTDTIQHGEYAFSIYAWRYVGVKPHFHLVTVCENDQVSLEMTDIIQSGSTGNALSGKYEERWQALENKQISIWNKEREQYKKSAEVSASYKLESMQNNFKNQKHTLEEQKIHKNKLAY